MLPLPRRVQITEVGMRDGFQMEDIVLETARKIEIGRAFIEAGVSHLEATSFVSAAAVPQLADAAQVIAGLKGRGAVLHALVPNANGARRAAAAGVDRMTVFVSASETHNRRNVRRSVTESLAALPEIASIARDAGIELGGGVSTSFGCPFEGDIPLAAVLRVVEAYAAAGLSEVSLGDTTGMATPPIVESIVGGLRERFPGLPLALHFHNTRALGLVNVMTGLELGIDRYESSVGGLGGCPFAVGATGNVCTEDLVNMLHELGVETGIDLGRLIRLARSLEQDFRRPLPGQLMRSGPRLPPSSDASDHH
jgi:hydroxymethylglutaryl-CoA lyase